MSDNDSNNSQQTVKATTTSSVGCRDLLELFLGLHGTRRMPDSAWDFLTVRDLVSCRRVSRAIYHGLKWTEYYRCRDGRDYWVPFPGYPGLLATAADRAAGAGLFAHQLASLAAMHRAENASLTFGALRGGILGDAPGLGKTITMLALMASTAGTRPVNPPEFWDETGIGEGWRLLRTNHAGRHDILLALKPIRDWVYAYLPEKVESYKRLSRYVEPPFTDDRLLTLDEFETYVKRELKSFVPSSQLELFRLNMVHLKAGLDKRNRKVLKQVRGAKRLTWERTLIPSSATLVIVPDALLEHWFQQIQQHLNLDLFVDNDNNNNGRVVYLDGIGDLKEILQAKQSIRNASVAATVTAQPWELSQYLIVVTTFSRCQAEFDIEVEAGRMEGIESLSAKQKSRKRRHQDAVYGDLASTPLLRMRWLRLCVDEGHELGTHAAGSAVTRFINHIAAERRWVLSGTPTTGDEDDPDYASSALDQLQRLLFFLRHPKYGTIPKETKNVDDEEDGADEGREVAKDAWITNVKDNFLARKPQGKEELLRVLKETLVLHRKEDIHLPAPIFRQIENDVLIPDKVEKTLMANAASSLHLVHMFDEYLHSTDFQSLVDMSQATYIVSAVQKARRALLDRGGSLEADTSKPCVVAEMNYMEQRDLRPIKAVVYSSEKNNLLSVTEHIIRQLSFENVAEMYEAADIGDLSAELSRFRHGFKEFKTCPVCGRENDATENRRGDRCTETLLEVVAIQDGRRMLIEPERIRRTINVELERLQGEPLSSYGKLSKFWRVGDMLEVDIRDPHPILPRRLSRTVWKSYGSQKCKKLARAQQFQGRNWYFGPLAPANDENNAGVLVYLQKWQRCGVFHNYSWYKGPRLADQPIERIKQDVCILSLDAGLSHGLDLSFVTHIFLLEPIEDAALLEQVTSRAHRLGATGPVTVETVNTFWEVSKEMEANLGKVTDRMDESSSLIQQNKEKVLSKVVCQHCYRQFDSYRLAEDHERTSCPRNPENASVVDPFHLSSVYREIRPPPPLASDAVAATTDGEFEVGHGPAPVTVTPSPDLKEDV